MGHYLMLELQDITAIRDDRELELASGANDTSSAVQARYTPLNIQRAFDFALRGHVRRYTCVPIASRSTYEPMES